jgi:ABC-type uncharacterized transport system permease subunit
MTEALDLLFNASLWAAVLRIATPLIFGVLGALLCERAGVLNLGIEGIMTMGAMVGWLSVFLGADLWTGLLIAAAAGALMGLLHAMLTVPLGLSQHVSGLGITLFRLGAGLLPLPPDREVGESPPTIEPFRPLDIPSCRTFPSSGRSCSAGGAHLPRADRRGGHGLCAEPHAARPCDPDDGGEPARGGGAGPGPDADPRRLRHGGLGADGAGRRVPDHGGLQQLLPRDGAGAGLDLHRPCGFRILEAGKGALGALLFAFFDAYQLRLQTVVEGVPYQLFLMAPYILSIVALILVARRAQVPEALMTPYRRGER